jgi:DNA-binding NarL/FixJ family response regulator
MSIRLVIVDDHALVREGLVRLLSSQSDIDVVGVSGDGPAALKQANALKPDVLLLDLALPGLNGLEVAARVTSQCPSTHVLMLSMHSEAEYAHAAVERGASGLVSKSASAEELVTAIRAVARGETLPIPKRLSSREVEVLTWIARGKDNDEIAEILSIRPKTVEGHCQQLMNKLGIHTRSGLLAFGRQSSYGRS